MDIFELEPENLDEDDWEIKFWIWSRKIQDEVLNMEEKGESTEDIKNYLYKCADMREKFLNPNDLTETEEFYMEEMEAIWKEYGITDPINT